MCHRKNIKIHRKGLVSYIIFFSDVDENTNTNLKTLGKLLLQYNTTIAVFTGILKGQMLKTFLFRSFLLLLISIIYITYTIFSIADNDKIIIIFSAQLTYGLSVTNCTVVK